VNNLTFPTTFPVIYVALFLIDDVKHLGRINGSHLDLQEQTHDALNLDN